MQRSDDESQQQRILLVGAFPLAGRDVFATDVRGGTTLVRNEIPWAGADKVILVDTPGLGEVEGETREATASQAAKDATQHLAAVLQRAQQPHAGADMVVVHLNRDQRRGRGKDKRLSCPQYDGHQKEFQRA